MSVMLEEGMGVIAYALPADGHVTGLIYSPEKSG